jgi:hypothetical protein
MTVYRMYTEDVNRNRIISVLNNHFDGYTIIPTIGAWRGQLEDSLLIEVFNTTKDVVLDAATEIARVNNQEAVAVFTVQAEVYFQTAERKAA